MADASLPIPAATLVIFREADGARPKLLMVERAGTMAFAGGASVFPGGRVDPGDYALAATFAGDPDDLAARIAAIRETIEEVGIAIGVVPMPGDAALERLRAALHDGVAFGAALAAERFALDPGGLTPFARWRPSHHASRVFDTRFYLAALPADAPEPVVDGTENVRVFWAGARDLLDAAEAGRLHIIFPTRRNLERLSGYASHAEACADAAAFPIRTISPWIEDRGGVDHLCIPNDLGYPITAEPMSNVARG